MLSIQKMIIKYNYSKRNSSIKYIVIHDTGNSSKGAGVKSHFNYFNSGNRNASADYFVDDNSIGQFVEDKNKSWHCGDGAGKYGITNDNSIGIEICINSDGDYAIAVQNTADLTKYLMQKYNIPAERVVRHYDASRKYCPNSMRTNDWETWRSFKNLIDKNIPTTEQKPTQKPTGATQWVLNLQRELNKQGFRDKNKNKLVEDGLAGPLTLSACPLLKKGAKGNITRLMQEKLNVAADGVFGLDTLRAVKELQRKKNLIQDGIVGQDTWEVLIYM